MGRISLSGPDGRELASAFFGVSTGNHESSDDIANDGTITDVEVSFAREGLEEEINRYICGYGGPLGLGGWGGVSEVCIQPWKLNGETERRETPDGTEMPITVRLTEDYRVPVGLVFSSYRSVERSVPMTARWESGRVRLYQCTPPPYSPPPPPPPPPDPGKWMRETGQAIADGVDRFFNDAYRVADGAATSLRHYLFS